MILLFFLIFFFTILIIYQIFNNNIVEGVTTQNAVGDKYKDYAEDPMILAKQNAGNIQVLREQLNSLMGLDTKIEKVETNVKQLQEQVNAMRDAQVASAVKEIPVLDNTEQ
jgi:hypothetical protein